MAKNVINSFNAGELSPYLYARSDFEKYRSGCLTMENFVPLPYGGATRRPAIEYLGNSKQNDKVRLIPFMSSISASYVLELGDKYVRFWKDGVLIEDTLIPVEIGSPWSDTELNDIKVAQSIDVMWLVHPDHAPQRISRYSDISWTIGDEEFDFPPLLDENDTDITMTPSATTGTITLTSSQDFFDEGHVGSYMSFTTLRTLENRSISGSFTDTDATDELYVSNANWSASTTGSWRGRAVVQRSLDGKISWEDYVFLGDTTNVSTSPDGRKNFAASSDAEEPTGAWVRILYITQDGTFNYQLDTNDDWNTLVKITGYIDSKNVTAQVIDEFQYIESDYTEWVSGNSYSVGDQVVYSASLSYSSTPVSGTDFFNLVSIDSDLTNVTGMDFGGGYYWITTDDGSGGRNLWKLNSGLTAVESGFPVDVSSYLTTRLDDIAWYSNELYVSGVSSYHNRVQVFGEDGAFKRTALSSTVTVGYIGMGYHNNYFYVGAYAYNPAFPTQEIYQIQKLTTSFAVTGLYIEDAISHDFCGVQDKLYSINDSGFIDIYNESLVVLGGIDINSQTSDARGIAYNGSDIMVVSDVGVVYKYSFNPQTVYYECIKANSSTGLDQNEWSVRNPLMTTWSEGAFSDYRGHPSCIALFESRLCYAGTEKVTDTIWTSQIDDYSNFQLGSLDTDALKLTLNSGSNDAIQWLVPQERLVIGTVGAEWSLGASDERKPITPTGFDLKRKTTYGSVSTQAILVNSAVLFLMRQARKIREWTPNYNAQDYVAADLTILAEHITEGGIQLWEYQQQPDNILWSIRADGTLLGFTYERDQNVTGWHRHSNDEFLFESLAIIPREREEDEIYVSVNIDGSRVIARLNDREWGTSYATEWQGSDLWVNYQSAGDASHLIGKTVDIVVDGVIQDQEVVDGTGSISATLGTNNIVGLPFTSTISPVYINSDNQYGTSQGSKTDIRTATVRFKDTFSAKVSQIHGDLETVKFDPDETALYSEDAPVWFDNSSEFLQSCRIVQDEPMPCTVLALITRQEVRR